MDVFISYSTKDYIDSNQNPIKGNVISVLEELFQSNGITYWIDRDGIYSGSEFAQVIARNIKKCDILLFVSSENSNHSKWTSNELATAIEYNKLIIPFRIDESSYHEDIVLYLAKLDYISYFANQEKALKRLLVAISDYKGELERERLETLRKKKEEEERLRYEEEKKRELYLKEQELKEKERLAAIALEKQRQIEELNDVHNQIYELEQSIGRLQDKKDELEKEEKKVCREIETLKKRLEHLDTKRIIIETQFKRAYEPKIAFKEFKDTTYIVNGVSFKMIAVKGGTFQMGSNDGEEREKPVHQVTLNDYSIGETEVTQELWSAVMGSNPSRFSGNSQRPVEMVSWNDCQVFISKLNKLTGEKFRLPTEAQWEYAARGGNKSKDFVYSGSNRKSSVVWCEDNSFDTTHPVKAKMPNELGIYDMSGNVWEWCSDWYGTYSSAVQTDSLCPSSHVYRVIRGGSWSSYATCCRVAFRNNYAPANSNSGLGLRLAISLTSAEAE